MAWEPQTELPGGFADEAGLVAALRAGRSEAFEALHAAYAPRIYNLALRIVDDQEEAQDVAQEVLLKVFRGLPDNETDLNLPAWLYRVTVNTAFDHVRARKRRPVTVAEEAAPEIMAAVDEYERAELARRVESSLRQLPKRQQLALVLRDVNGLSVGETASVLGLTKGSADVLLSRARAGFRRVFLAGAGSLTGRCDRADRVLAACVGRGERVPAALLEHSRTCSDCRRAVRFWGAAPVGLGLLLPQVALPAKLSLGATLAAAHAAGIALPAGLGAAGAAGASVAASGASAAGAAGAAAGAAAADGAAAASAGGAGLLAALASATGVKVATLAAVATTVVGIAGVSAQRAHTSAGLRQRPTGQVQSAGMAAQGGHPGGDGSGLSPREHALLVSRAHRSGPAAGWSEGGGPRSAGSGGAGTRVGRTGASVSAGGGQSRSGDAAGSAVGSTHSNGTTGGSGSGSGGQGSGSDGGQSTRGSGSGGDAGRSGAAGSGGGQPGDHGSGSSGGKFSQE